MTSIMLTPINLFLLITSLSRFLLRRPTLVITTASAPIIWSNNSGLRRPLEEFAFIGGGRVISFQMEIVS